MLMRHTCRYNAKADRVSLRKLVDALDVHGGGMSGGMRRQDSSQSYAWGGGYGWMALAEHTLRRPWPLQASFNSIMPSASKPRRHTSKEDIIRSGSGTEALMRRLPPFVGEWYAHWAACGRKRWTANDISEISDLPRPQAAARGTNAVDEQPTPMPKHALGAQGTESKYGDAGEAGTATRDAAAVASAGGADVYPQSGDVKTNWADLMLWAVLANEPSIAQHCWSKSTEPMRFAIWAAHVAHAASLEQHVDAKRKEWEAAADEYESWAVAVLSQEVEPDAAAKQLTFASEFFDASAIDHAIVIDPVSRRCRSFVAHAHCTELARRYWLGDYPGSRACIPASSSWARILLHCLLLGLLPILDVTVRRKQHDASSASSANLDDVFDEDDDSEDEGTPLTTLKPEWVAQGTAGHAGGRLYALLAPLRPLLSRLRILYHVLNIPCVKFATHNLLAVCYTVFLAVGLCGLPWDGASWMTHRGVLEIETIPTWEWISWAWNFMRLYEELQQYLTSLASKDRSADYFDTYNLVRPGCSWQPLFLTGRSRGS